MIDVGAGQPIGSLVSDSASETESVAARFGRTLVAGDVVVLTGLLGAGKTTLTRGLARGVGIAEPVTSPTYAIAFVHEQAGSAPDLVHVDAYRLTGLDDLEAVDLDPLLPKSITVIEWGRDYVAELTDRWVELELDRPAAASQEDLADQRGIAVTAHGDFSAARIEQWQAIFGSAS